MKSALPFLLVFLVLVAAAWGYASLDPITPAVVEARAETTAGPVRADVLNQAFAWLLKFVTAAGLAGVLAFVWKEILKHRELWWRENTTRRWRSGPNANYQRQASLPKLKREDLMLLALSGKRLPQVNTQEAREDDEIKLDF